MFQTWKNLSITKKLYFVFGTMAVLITCELLALRFSMHTLSAVRAFVGGEGLWSKAQKNAAISLQRYALTHDEREYRDFLDYLKIPDGDHQARVELEKPVFDMSVVRRGFIQGRIHPDDIDAIVDLLRHFYWVSYVNRAVAIWAQGDQMLGQFKAEGERFHRLLSSRTARGADIGASQSELQSLNQQLTMLEENFSNTLGEGSRWLERVVITLLFLAVLSVESIGLTLTFFTSRSISRGLAELDDTAKEIGKGNFDRAVPIRSQDELGRLAASVNQMGKLLRASYEGLESRVRERTVELSKLAAENARLYEETKTALHLREEFLSIASHELKTPMTALSLQLQLLEHGLGGAGSPNEGQLTKMREQVAQSLRQTRRVNTLIDELLDLTRLQTGRFELAKEQVDLSSLAREVVAQFSLEAKRAGSSLSVEAPAPVSVELDPVRAGQVLTNLISNAIKYGGGASVLVSVRLTDGKPSFTVQDQGPGIPLDVQERIFGRFERAVSDPRVSGLGLGLYICRRIVEAHGGTISLWSRPGAGAKFTVEFPA